MAAKLEVTYRIGMTLGAWLLVGGLLSAEELRFQGATWDVQGEASIESHQRIGVADAGASGESDPDDEALHLGGGRALLSAATLGDGTIDVDVAFSRERSFVYLLFRMQGDHDYEEIYLRPHKSTLPDALQYAPVFHGVSAWQLHHGVGATAPARLQAGRWVHLRLVLEGAKAAVFLDHQTEPTLVIPRLARGAGAGGVGLRSFVPAGSDALGAYFRNLRLREGFVPYDFTATAPPLPPGGAITAWEISSARPAPQGAVTVVPEELVWRQVATDEGGVLNFDRHLERPERAALVFARLHLRSERPVLQALRLGASDNATVLLNGRPLYSSEGSYRPDQPRRDGVLTLDHTVYLPLEAGDNELVLAVDDSFGGWGVMAAWEPLAGVTQQLE